MNKSPAHKTIRRYTRTTAIDNNNKKKPAENARETGNLKTMGHDTPCSVIGPDRGVDDCPGNEQTKQTPHCGRQCTNAYNRFGF